MTGCRQSPWWPMVWLGCAVAVAPPVAATSARVFYSPAERAAIETTRRAQLDAGRSVNARLPAAPTPDTTGEAGFAPPTAGAAPGAAAGGHGRLEGVALASGAHAAAWIDGHRLVDGGRFGGYRLRVASNGVRLIARDGRERFVRVGDEVAP